MPITRQMSNSDQGHIINLQHDWVLSPREFLEEPISQTALGGYCPRLETGWDAGRQPCPSPPVTQSGEVQLKPYWDNSTRLQILIRITMSI